ncbi:hypothetical protein MHU86_8429 [Fragilaria crotonensis]|nr:hypothetical protein MHU86_8429 [Fragilaria crotonensis]
MNSSNKRGVIVVVAKCPLPGTSKTRLIPLLGEDGSANLAKAMLSDILLSLVQYMKGYDIILYYAPGTDEGRMHMHVLLHELGIVDDVELLPMLYGDLRGQDLGDQLSNAFYESRRRIKSGNVMFLGMDSPELPIEELEEAFRHPMSATLCPSHDGGYGMLCVPLDAPDDIFSNVLWSHPLTALSQLKVLTDRQVSTRLGRIMYDVDEPEDVRKLRDRLLNKDSNAGSDVEMCNLKSLQESSTKDREVTHCACPLTKQALLELDHVICGTT